MLILVMSTLAVFIPLALMLACDENRRQSDPAYVCQNLLNLLVLRNNAGADVAKHNGTRAAVPLAKTADVITTAAHVLLGLSLSFLLHFSSPAMASDPSTLGVIAANYMPVLNDDGSAIPNTSLGPIEMIGPKIGLTKQDIARARATVGRISCGLPGRRASFDATGFLIGPRILATAAHVFEHDDGASRVGDNRCSFTNLAAHPKTVGLKTDSAHLKFYTRDLKNESGKDLAIVLLDRGPTAIDPFPVDASDRLLFHRERLVAISAFQDGVTSDAHQPLAQLCTHRKWSPEKPTSFRLEYTDCASEEGASGGLLLVRQNGTLSIRAVICNSGKKALDGQPYDLMIGSYTEAVTLNAGIINDVLSFDRSHRR